MTAPAPSAGAPSDKPVARPRAGARTTRPWWLWWREPSTLRGALSLMAALLALLWIVELVDLLSDHALMSWGLRPRELGGLVGIGTSPFLHTGVGHLLSNSLPFLLLGWFAMAGGFVDWLIATAIIVIVGGLATWAVAPSGLVVGASGLVMGWLGYLLARAAFTRRIVAIAVAVLTLIYFGSLMRGMLPTVRDGVSWQGHLCGFAAGILAAWLLHIRDVRAKTAKARAATAAAAAKALP